MVSVIDGNWDNGSLIHSFEGTKGINTVGTRVLGEGIFYFEIRAINGRANLGLLFSPIQNKSWVSSGNFTDSLYIGTGTLDANDVIGVLLDLSDTIGYVYWRKNNLEFSGKIPLVSNLGQNIINNIRVGVAGTSSSIGSTSYELIYDTKKFITKESTILDLVNRKEVYSFDGNYKLKRNYLLLQSNDKFYSLAEKTLITLPNASDKNMILHGIEAGKEIKLDEEFDKIRCPFNDSATLGAGKVFELTLEDRKKILKSTISEVN